MYTTTPASDYDVASLADFDLDLIKDANIVAQRAPAKKRVRRLLAAPLVHAAKVMGAGSSTWSVTLPVAPFQ